MVANAISANGKHVRKYEYKGMDIEFSNYMYLYWTQSKAGENGSDEFQLELHNSASIM